MRKTITGIIVCLFTFCSIPFGQDNDNVSKEPLIKRIKFSGPRIGIVQYNQHFGQILKDAFDIPSTLILVGWENELKFTPQHNGLIGTTKLIWLFAGFEQGVFLPQFNWQIGLITETNLEFGIGPHLSFTGPALCFSVEKTIRSSSLTFPISMNIAVQGSDFFVSVLLGFEAFKE